MMYLVELKFMEVLNVFHRWGDNGASENIIWIWFATANAMLILSRSCQKGVDVTVGYNHYF